MSEFSVSDNRGEYTTGWKKVIRENSRERKLEESYKKIGEFQDEILRLKNQLDSIKKKEAEGAEHRIAADFEKLNNEVSTLTARIEELETSFLEYKKQCDNQMQLIMSILDLIREREHEGLEMQRGVFGGLFKKK